MISQVTRHLRGLLRRGPACLLALLALLIAQGYVSYSSNRYSVRASNGRTTHVELPLRHNSSSSSSSASVSPSAPAPRRSGYGNITKAIVNEVWIANEDRGSHSIRRDGGSMPGTTAPSGAPNATLPYYKFPRWGDEGIRVSEMVEYIMERLQSRKTETFSSILYVWGGDTQPGKGDVWVSEVLRSRTQRGQIRYRAEPVEGALKRAYAYFINRSNRAVAITRWPNLARTMNLHRNATNLDIGPIAAGVPLILWYGDFRDCNQHNYQKNGSVPLLTTCARITCDYAFPFPNYRTIRDSLPVATDWDAVLEQQRSAHPWERKIPKLVWRGGLTGALENFSSPRSRLGTFALKHMDHPLLDIGIHQIPSRHFHRLTNKTIPTDLEKRILMKPPMPADNFSDYRAILDTDGNSWSSRFGKLLCANSVVLKVEPLFVDYFYRYLSPWVHYIPVRRDLSNLLEQVEWAVDPSNDVHVRRIVAEANAWCREHMTLDAVTHDMLDVLDVYVSHLDRGDINWRSTWMQERARIWNTTAGFKMRKL